MCATPARVCVCESMLTLSLHWYTPTYVYIQIQINKQQKGIYHICIKYKIFHALVKTAHIQRYGISFSLRPPPRSCSAHCFRLFNEFNKQILCQNFKLIPLHQLVQRLSLRMANFHFLSHFFFFFSFSLQVSSLPKTMLFFTHTKSVVITDFV